MGNGRGTGLPAADRGVQRTGLPVNANARSGMGSKIRAGSLVFGAFSGDAHSLLICVYKDPNIPLDIRIDAARAAIAYEKPRLLPAPPVEPAEAVEAKTLRLHQLLQEMALTVGGGDRVNGGSNGLAVSTEGSA